MPTSRHRRSLPHNELDEDPAISSSSTRPDTTHPFTSPLKDEDEDVMLFEASFAIRQTLSSLCRARVCVLIFTCPPHRSTPLILSFPSFRHRRCCTLYHIIFFIPSSLCSASRWIYINLLVFRHFGQDAGSVPLGASLFYF